LGNKNKARLREGEILAVLGLCMTVWALAAVLIAAP
jgi:hypothetical protein